MAVGASAETQKASELVPGNLVAEFCEAFIGDITSPETKVVDAKERRAATAHVEFAMPESVASPNEEVASSQESLQDVFASLFRRLYGSYSGYNYQFDSKGFASVTSAARWCRSPQALTR